MQKFARMGKVQMANCGAGIRAVVEEKSINYPFINKLNDYN